MKRLKGLDWTERQRRHHLIMATFKQHEGEDLPWMATISPNDPDVIIEMIREPVGVYTWFGKGDWISISIHQISQCVTGNYNFVEFGKEDLALSKRDDGIVINDIFFRTPPRWPASTQS